MSQRNLCGPGSSTGKELGYRMDGPGSIPGVWEVKIFLRSFVSRQVLGFTQLPIKWVPGVLRKIYGAKRDEITGNWRKLHIAELYTLYSSNITRNLKSRHMRWAGHVACMELSRNAYRVLAERSAGKRSLGRQRGRWEDNIKIDLREVVHDSGDWIHLTQDRIQ